MSKQILTILFISLTAITGCSSSTVVDHSEMDLPSVEERAFGGLEPYAIELLDELRLLAKTRSAKAQAMKPFEQRRQERMLSTMVLPGFDKKVDWSCQCEVETIAKGIAERVGYGSDRVFTYGTKPPGGVWVNLALNNQPIKDAISMIDAEKGAQIDFMIDHKVKTIVVKYLETAN